MKIALYALARTSNLLTPATHGECSQANLIRSARCRGACAPALDLDADLVGTGLEPWGTAAEAELTF